MPPERTSLAGKTILVTGASSGVGLAAASVLSEQGARVHALCRRVDRLPPGVTGWPVDLADDAAVSEFGTVFRAQGTPVHALIHCAGVLERRCIDDGAIGDIDEHFRVNARAPMQLTAALLEPLRAGRADVVFVNSTAALRPAAGVAGYAMSKAALAAFAETLRAEENANGLRVLTIYLGRTATAMQQKLAAQEHAVYRGDRLIAPEDVARLLVAALLLDERSELTELTLRPRFAPTSEPRHDGQPSKQ